jgi:hypothetical protein
MIRKKMRQISTFFMVYILISNIRETFYFKSSLPSPKYHPSFEFGVPGVPKFISNFSSLQTLVHS